MPWSIHLPNRSNGYLTRLEVEVGASHPVLIFPEYPVSWLMKLDLNFSDARGLNLNVGEV